MINVNDAQQFMKQAGIDAWLLYDFRNSNPIFWQVLGGKKQSTRRNFMLILREGPARLITHPIDADLFADCGIECQRYVDWQQLQGILRTALTGLTRVAMEYSPGAAIPVVSYVDAGTVELVRALGAEVVSSAELYQNVAARWSDAELDSHFSAARLLNQVKDEAFRFIGESITAGRSITEYDVAQFIWNWFPKNSLIADHPPIVGVNANSGNCHYQPTAEKSSPIRKGDWVLIDLWAKHPGERNVYADITWTGVVAPRPTARQLEIFRIVTSARDAVVQRLQQAWAAGETLQGWQVDRVCRGVIENSGYGQYFFHRTGHSMGPGDTVHALGVNLDDLETHDTRKLVPGIGFSVEPGIYMAEFGVRSEIDMFVHPKRGPIVTTSLQTEPVCIL